MAERWDPGESFVYIGQDAAGAGRRDDGVVDDAVPDLVRRPRDGPHPRRGRARRGQGRARGGPGGHQRRRVRVRRGWKTSRRASWPPTGRSPTAGTRRPSADSRSSTCAHARRRCSGLPRSPSPAAARRRSGRSGPTPNSTRCSARLTADGDVPAAPDGRRPAAALEQDLPWRRPDNAGLRIDPSRGTRGSASWAGREARSSWLTGEPGQPADRRTSHRLRPSGREVLTARDTHRMRSHVRSRWPPIAPLPW